MREVLKAALLGGAVAAAAVLAFRMIFVIIDAWEAFKQARKRDKYLIAAIVNLSWYCVAALVLTALDHAVPDSLTVAWFAAWTAELALLANIKIKGKDE